MRFYVREVIGWCLVALGLAVFYESYSMLTAPVTPQRPGHYIVEAGEVTVIGFIVFRGGIHLLKVAVAARVCLQAQERVGGQPPGASKAPAARPASR